MRANIEYFDNNVRRLVYKMNILLYKVDKSSIFSILII